MSCPCCVPANRVDYTKPTILLYKTQNNLTYKKERKKEEGDMKDRKEGSGRSRR